MAFSLLQKVRHHCHACSRAMQHAVCCMIFAFMACIAVLWGYICILQASFTQNSWLFCADLLNLPVSGRYWGGCIVVDQAELGSGQQRRLRQL